MSTSRRDFVWALTVLGLSGAAALGHQLLWTRRMADLIGATGDANARVFGCFFLGLALGAAAASRIIPSLRRPWRTAGIIELGIALLTLPALLMNHWSASLWPALGPDTLSHWQGAALKWLLSFLVVVPPAFLVGMTLPVLVCAVSGQEKSFSRKSVWLYAIYTAGGSLGIAVVIGGALPVLGVAGSMLSMMGLNAVAAGLCLTRESARGEIEPRAFENSAAMSRCRELPVRTLLAMSFFSGAGVLALEVAGLQVVNLKMPLAFYTPGAVLFCVVLLLAGSTASVPIVERWFKGAAGALVACVALAGVAMAVAPLLFQAVTAGRSGLGTHRASFTAALLELGWATCAAIGPAIFFSGMVFPLLICGLGRDDPSRGGFAQLLAVNGAGGLLGVEAAHRWLLPWLGPHLALGVLGAGYGLISLALAIAHRRELVADFALPIGSLAATAFLLLTLLGELPVFTRAATFNVVEVRSGREGTLAVAERPDVGRAIFLDNHYMLGCTAGTPEMQRQAHLPLLLHPEPKRVCFLGLGTGITLAGALKHTAVESIEAVELCPLVAEAAQKHFAQFNEGVCGHPKVSVRVEDARTYLSAARERWDVIIGDLFTPWRPGEARLCSLEQFNAAKNALRPGGAFCQWLPLTQLTAAQFELIADTFRQVFAETHVFRNQFQGRSLPVALIGFKDGTLDWNIVAQRCGYERGHGMLHDPLGRHAEGVALLYLGTYSRNAAPGAVLNTLDNLRVELQAGRQLLGGDPAAYFEASSDLWSGFVSRQVAAIEQREEMPKSLRQLPRLGMKLAGLQPRPEAGDAHPQTQRELEPALPRVLLDDEGADWSLMPAGYRRRP